MGCDIHILVEKYDEKSAKWKAVEGVWGTAYIDGKTYNLSIYNGRNYTLFGYLGSVRSDAFDEKSKPRGFPDDMSDEARELINNDFLHSFTSFTFPELAQWELWQVKKKDVADFYIPVFSHILRMEEPWNYRLLICFDS